MSTLKKLLAITLALAMVLSVSAFAGMYSAKTYKDAAKINGDCEEAVELMYALDIMSGNNNGEFMPEKTITRAEVAKMIFVILNYGKTDASAWIGAKMFDDVVAGSWYEGYVNYCAAMGIVAGYGNGKFGPADVVTGSQVAKMLLTAIGYKAADRGYVGANWESAVLTDAAVIGLMEGYNYNVNAAAPRQWVAVMFANALLKAYTYENMAAIPNIGVLNADKIGGYGYENIVTFGEKYFKVASFEGVAAATENAKIDGKDYAERGVLFFVDGKEKDPVDLKGTGLGYKDLGQNYHVIFNFETMKAYSVRSLAEVGVARVMDVTYETTHSTNNNYAKNKYVFTVGDLEAAFAGTEANVMLGNSYATIGFNDARDIVDDGMVSPDEVIAIDNGDGIEYMILIDYSYGIVTKVAESTKYGAYVQIEDTDGDLIKYNEGTNLYLDEAIIGAEDLEEGNIVKLVYNYDEDMIEVVDVIDEIAEAKFEARDTKNELYTFDGEDYAVPYETDKEWMEDIYEIVDDKDNMGDEYNIFVDGDLLVYISEIDGRYTSIDKVNEQLVLLIDAGHEYSHGSIRNEIAIEYMTIDGKTQTAVYNEDLKEALPFPTVSAIANEGWYFDRSSNQYRPVPELMGNTVQNRLFILIEKNGKVALKAIDEENFGTQLKVKPSVVDSYSILAEVTLNAEKTVTLDGDRIAEGNVFFYYDGDEDEYGVMKLADLTGSGKDEAAYAQVFGLMNERGTRNTVVAGYVAFDLDKSFENSDGYLFIEKIGKETKDGLTVTALFPDGKTQKITVTNDADDLDTEYLWAYTYDAKKDIYTLDSDFGEYAGEMIDVQDGKLIIEGNEKTELEMKKQTIAMTTITLDKDATLYADVDNDWGFEHAGNVEFENEFLKKDTLDEDFFEENIESGDDNTYYRENWVIVEDDLIYIIVVYAMNAAQVEGN